MKRYCKDVDPTNRDLVYRAVHDCLYGGNGKNRKPKFGRRDTINMFAEYSGLPKDFLKGIAKRKEYGYFDGIINTIVDGMIQEIKERDYVIKPIWYSEKKDGCSGKIRRIGIQDIKQQLYDYVAVYALEEVLKKKIGYYQCSAIKDRGQLMGAKAVKKWVDNHEMRWAWKGDVHHFYESIDRDKLKALLRKCVKNEAVLHLVFFLIDTFDKGLAIGSFLSQYLANFYLSYAYHFASEQLFKVRKKKNGTNERVKLVYHVLFYMDDMLLIGKSKKDIMMAAKRLEKFLNVELHLELKNEGEVIDLSTGYIDMMGFKISRKCVTVRSRIFLRARRTSIEILKAERTGKQISLKKARTMTSRYGWFGNSDTKHFCKRNGISKAMEIANKIIGGKNHAKNEVRHTDAGGGDLQPWQWQAGCCNPC